MRKQQIKYVLVSFGIKMTTLRDLLDKFTFECVNQAIIGMSDFV